MKAIKKSISILLALIMIIGVFAALPLTVGAVGGKTGDCDWSFDEATGKLSITGAGNPGDNCPWFEYENQIKSVYIGSGVTRTPTNVGDNIYIKNVTSVEIGDSVKRIGFNTFGGCSKLKTLKLGSGLTYIGEQAFRDCTALKSVTIPNKVTKIGPNAFDGCKKLAALKFGKGLKIISREAFAFCSALKSVTIPDSVTDINNEAFWGCHSLEKVSIGKKVSKLISTAFAFCKKLSKITVNKANAKFSTSGGSLFDKKKTTLLCYASGRSAKKYTVPKTVKTIGECAFESSDKLTVINTNKVKTIKNYAIDSCKALKKLILGDSVKKLIGNAVWSNPKLETVSIGKNLNMKSNILGRTDSIKKITVSKKNKNIYADNNGVYNRKDNSLVAAFNLKAKPNFTVKSGVKSVTADAFCGSDYIKGVVFPKSVKKVGPEIFNSCAKLVKVTVYNPKLDLSNSYLGVDGDEENVRTNITIACYKGSKAEQFAKIYDFKIKYL